MKSLYDPTRENVGKIYRDAQLSHDGYGIPVGDMKNSVLPDLVTDINENLMRDPYEGKPFYLLVTEKKDLQMPNAMARIPYIFSYRPYPEDNTLVFWKNPKTQELRFCWDLPHWAEMDNILENPFYYSTELVDQIIAWKKVDLVPFGFFYHPKEKWIPNPHHLDRRIESC